MGQSALLPTQWCSSYPLLFFRMQECRDRTEGKMDICGTWYQPVGRNEVLAIRWRYICVLLKETSAISNDRDQATLIPIN